MWGMGCGGWLLSSGYEDGEDRDTLKSRARVSCRRIISSGAEILSKYMSVLDKSRGQHG
jgi:hypothetical protein